MKIAFAGTPEVSAAVLRNLAKRFDVVLVITRPDAPQGREKKLAASPVAEIASKFDLPLIKSKKIDDQVLLSLRESGAEIVIVVAFGSLISKRAIDQIRWWNLHFSLLPQWRGATPLQHSLIYGTGQGITLFEIDEGLDTGNVVSSVPLTLDRNRTAAELLLQLADIGSELVANALTEQPNPFPQQGEPSFAPKISRTEAQISFAMAAPEIEARVMALNPEPTAWCNLEGGALRILRARAIGDIDWNAVSETPLETGTLERRKNSVLVVCGEGSRLELLEVQPAGKKPMAAIDWARGFSGLKIG